MEGLTRVRNRHFKQPSTKRWETAGIAIVAVVALVVCGIALFRTEPLPATGSMPTWTWSPSIPKPSPVAVFLGDSYTQGGDVWTSLVSAKQGWREVNLGRGGTGYVATSSQQGCGLNYCPKYDEMIPEAVKAKPDVVVVAGGRNDGSADAKAIRTFYQDLRTQLPNAKIYAISPLWASGETPAFIVAQGQDVKASVEAVGGTFLDVGQPFKGRPDLISSDAVHPNEAGYKVLGEDVLRLLGSG